MTKKKQTVAPSAQIEMDLDAAPTSDPLLDGEQAVENSIAVLVRVLGDSNYRIIRRKIKVGGVWYHVEVSRP